MTSSSEQPPKEYIITENQLDEIFAFLQNPPMMDIPEFTLAIEGEIRSRPHPAPARIVTKGDIACINNAMLEEAARKAREDVLNRLDKEIAIRENEMNRKAGLEDNIVTVSGYYSSAGALNWVRVVLIDGSRDTIDGDAKRQQAGDPK